MIYGPVISQWSCSLSFARPPDPAATPSQVGEMCANHTLWGLLNRRSWAGGGAGRGAANRGPLMKLIFNSMCILMKQAGLGDDTRPPLRDANEAVSRSEDSSNTGAPSPRHALIYEWNAPLGASDPRDVLKDLYSVGSELVKQTARPCRLFTCNHRYDLITSERLSVALTTIIICTCLLLDMVSSPPNFNTAAEHMFSGGSRDLRESFLNHFSSFKVPQELTEGTINPMNWSSNQFGLNISSSSVPQSSTDVQKLLKTHHV